MPAIRTGLDIAKNVFQPRGVDQDGKIILRKRPRRQEVLSFALSGRDRDLFSLTSLG
jgi:hypothetical protein